MLSDARQQTHHAAQLATAVGISFLPHQADDSHTNLEWLPALGALSSRVVPSRAPFRVAIRVAELELCVLDDHDGVVASLPLHERTVADAAAWLRDRVVDRGAPAAKFTLAKHYEIPHHAVDDGRPFDTADRSAFEQLAAWFEVASRALEWARAANSSSEVRCWPHHFDIATLIEVSPERTVGVGLEPGDAYYNEPYFYVNAYPNPPAESLLPALGGGGSWHTREWVGAVLPGSRVSGGKTQVHEFLDSAIAACRRLAAAAPAPSRV